MSPRLVARASRSIRQPGTKPSAGSQGPARTLPKTTATASFPANASSTAASQPTGTTQSSPVIATRSASVFAAPALSARLSRGSRDGEATDPPVGLVPREVGGRAPSRSSGRPRAPRSSGTSRRARSRPRGRRRPDGARSRSRPRSAAGDSCRRGSSRSIRQRDDAGTHEMVRQKRAQTCTRATILRPAAGFHDLGATTIETAFELAALAACAVPAVRVIATPAARRELRAKTPLAFAVAAVGRRHSSPSPWSGRSSPSGCSAG